MDFRKPNNAIFYNFQEGNIEYFAPTFKITPGSDKFGNKRVPSWTDRIIYRTSQSKDEQDCLTLVNYDSNNLIKFSDHRPVFAQFLLSLA